MATTPTYGWPYQVLADPPDGASLGEDLALGIEATVAALAASLAAAQANITTLQGQVTTLEGQALYRARQTVSVTPTASVTFSSIPATLRSLELRWTGRMNAGGAVGLRYRINNDSAAAQYTSTDAGTDNAAFSGVNAPAAETSGQAGLVCGNTNANEFSGGFVYWTGWDAPHSTRLTETFLSFAQAAANRYVRWGGSTYIGASPYTRLDLFPASNSFEAGTSFELVGIPA